MTVLATDRLTLRRMKMDDWPAYRDFYASSAAAFVSGPADEKTAWRMFSGQAGHWPLMGFGWFMLESASGPVGTCGLHHPPYQADLEIGWLTFEMAQGKGYATEAARAVLEWAPTVTSAPRIVSYIESGNGPSKRVAEKLGARFDGEMAAHNPACEVWVHAGAAA
ncbi:MAG: GNAT family N-acetyltransferase [Pseudomonadota bacterium]